MTFKYVIKLLKIILDTLVCRFRELRPHRRSDFASCGSGVYASPGVRFYTPKNISIGHDVYFGPGCEIFGYGGVSIEDDVVCGDHVTIIASNHEFDSPDVDSVPFGSRHVSRPVIIGRGTWLGSHVIVRPGATLGKFVVVGAGAVIGGHAEDFGIYAGNPAKLVSSRKHRNIESVPYKWVESKRGSIRIIE